MAELERLAEVGRARPEIAGPRAREGVEPPRRRRRLRGSVRAARRQLRRASRSRPTACGPAAPPPTRCSRGGPPRPASPGWSGRSAIPGSVGGAVRMNAGGHGAETSDRLVGLPGRRPPAAAASALVDGRAPSSCPTGTRRSAPDDVVTEASFRLEHGDAAASTARIAEIVRWRREHQPGGQNAGSVFTEPARRRRRASRRGGGPEGVPHRLGGRVRQARQFHPGRSRRVGRRREAGHRRGPGPRRRAARRRAADRAARWSDSRRDQ